MNVIRNFCRLNNSQSYNFYSKNVFVNFKRTQVTVPKSLKIEKTKKESGDFVKWILLVMPVSAFGLGTWQVYRLQWKLELIAMMKAKSNATPVELPTDLSQLDNMEYVPVKVKGQFLHEKELLIGPRALIEENSVQAKSGSLATDPKKNQGWLVVTPFKLKDTGEVILINRGWIPQKLRPKELRQASMVKGDVELVGVVRLTENRPPFMSKNRPESGHWSYRDLYEMSSILDTSPVWLDARGIPDPPDTWPIPNQTRVSLRNEHLSYVVTWYLLSAFTSVMWYRYFITKLPLV